MKQFFASIFFLVLSTTFLFAQKAPLAKDIQAATDAIIQRYQLDEAQAQQAYTIEERRLKNLAEITELEKSNYKLFLQKRKSIRTGADASLKKMLREDQMEIFNAEVIERRKKHSEKIKAMRANGASKEEIQMAILELDQ